MANQSNSGQQRNPQQAIEWQDVAGDVAAPNTGQPDIVKVGWESDGRNVILRIMFHQDLEQSLRKSMQTKGIGYAYFDTDNKSETGDEAGFFSESPGFELQGNVSSGIRFKDGYTVSGTNMSVRASVKSPRACSGDIYLSVPMTMPGLYLRLQRLRLFHR
jgi:hypothetical protein